MANTYILKKIRTYYCTFHLDSERSLMYSIIYATNRDEAHAIARKRYGISGMANVYTEAYYPNIQKFKMKLFEEVPHEVYGKGEDYSLKRRHGYSRLER